MVDRTGYRIPEGHRTATGASGAVGRVPGTPLTARECPRVACSEDVFELTFMPHGIANLARNLARRRPLESVPVDISVFIFVDIYKLKRAEIDSIGTKRPRAVEKLGKKNLKRQRHPAAGRAAVDNSRMSLADALGISLR